MTRPPKHPRQRRDGTTRTRVLEAALELFAERGYGGSSLQDIADALGISKAAVYYHFPAKAEMLRELAAPVLDTLDEILAGAPDRFASASCRRMLGEYLDAVIAARLLTTVLLDDPTARNHPATTRCLAQRVALRNLLVKHKGDETDTIRAACALGAIQGGVFGFPRGESGNHKDAILDAATSALGSDAARTPAKKRRER